MQDLIPSQTPPFCPNPACPHHRDAQGWKYKRSGFHQRAHSPFLVQRYRCLGCHRSFSDQTFRLGYWMHRQDLFEPVFQGLVACSGLRQIARQLGLTHVSVMRRVERLGRHCVLVNQLVRPRGGPQEPIVLDGFESFEHSQYSPLHINLVVGASSFFVYAFTESELRRKGRMTAYQARRRCQLEARHGRPDPKAIEKGVAEVLRLAVPPGAEVELRSDDHPAYRRALRSLGNRRTIHHHVTPSTQARTRRNPLFAVNLTDLLLRHVSANHKRETIAFSKRPQAVIERASVFVTWRNLLKSRSEKARDAPPAVALGLIDRVFSVDELLARRLFPHRVMLPPLLQAYYDRRVTSRRSPKTRLHDLRYAY